ncbi:MAG: OmpA family protein [Myxococcales bacterium]|nr:OmpA family protein [Myxococcota bacterium]MDW8282490.1 OmpA family protein [Myxococcales bacterium]
MRCSQSVLLGLLMSVAPAQAQVARFDVQTFRPTPGPRDLVIVPQTQPLSHLSASAGAFLHFQLDPLSLLNLDGERVASVVRNRLQLDLLGAVGLFDWVELGLVAPIVLFQQSDNLEVIGQEGFIRASAFSDLSLITKVPIFKRLPYASGFGMAVSLRLNIPLPGAQEAFAGDGSLTYNPTLLADYRFGMGALIAAQAGVHFRPQGEFFDAVIGPAVTANLGAELPIVRRWGLTTVGGLYANFPVSKLPDSPYSIPAMGLLGLRWYADFGVTFTTGINFGAACNFGVPSFGFFLSAIWVPLKTREHEAILHFKRPPDDPDGDGIIGDKDRCPQEPGPVENHGCPIRDTDKDGIPDHLDDCPTLAGTYNGCPRVFARGNKIRVLEKVHFATDQDVILPESFSVLEEVAQLIRAHPEWQEILVEGHCDFRASDAYNLDLSQRRAASVVRFLQSRGVEPSRLRAQGFGRSRPIADNRTEEGMALNRRVEFTLIRVAPAQRTPAGGKP